MRLRVLLVLVVVPWVAWAVPADEGGSSPYEVQVLVNGQPVREYRHQGDWFIEGRKDARYAIRVINRTARRVEVVVTVDGLDVLDGRPGDYRTRRGYVLRPWQTYDIEGFRLDMGRVAAFRFSTVARSYAARTGDARNVGVIGVAFFPEERPRSRLPMGEIPRIGRPFPEREESPEEGAGGFRTRAESREIGGLGGGMGSGKMDLDVATGSAEASPAPSASLPAARPDRAARQRPGLGTEFGEARASAVVETRFVRENPTVPLRLVVIRYDDRDGLRAMGVPVDDPEVCDSWLRRTAEPFPAIRPPRPFARPPEGWRP